MKSFVKHSIAYMYQIKQRHFNEKKGHAIVSQKTRFETTPLFYKQIRRIYCTQQNTMYQMG